MLNLLIHSLVGGGVTHAISTGAALVAKEGIKLGAKEAFEKARSSPATSPLQLQTPLTHLLLSISLDTEQSAALEKFLRSDFFTTFLESSVLVKGTDSTQVGSLIPLLADSLTKHVSSLEEASALSLASELVSFIEEAAADAWNVALEHGFVEPNWNVGPVAQSILADTIDANLKTVAKLQLVTGELLREFDASSARYRAAVAQQYAKLRPQSLQGTEEAPIDELYVASHFTGGPRSGGLLRNRRQHLSAFRRGVLLGNPGGGKSTFAAKLCHDLSTRYSERIVAGRLLTPMLITLRDYARFRKEHPCSIVEYLAIQSRTEYQLSLQEDFFSILLLSGQALVIFDGLDELIETTDRVGIRNTVEHFVSAFPAASVLVTSREVGYEKAPLDRSKFYIYKLAPFDNQQVLEYARKWFFLSRTGSDEDKLKLVNAFLEESQVIPDIRSNPLMLGLLCNLYKQDGFLPKNRPDVYSRCADLLFTRWDRHRGITVHLPMETKLRPAMAFLAHWSYSDETLAAGVPERKLIAATSSYISQWREDADEANAIATEFVNFFKGRAWVFTDTGSDNDESLYQFTHRTFLEYFTAEQLVKTYSDPNKLHDHLISRISRREWDVVCQLAYQINAKNTESHDVLAELLLNSLQNDDHLTHKLTVLSFTARVLDLLYPPSVRRAVVRACVSTVMSNVSNIKNDTSQADLPNLLTEITSALVWPPAEERKTNSSEIVKSAVAYLQNSNSLDESADAVLWLQSLFLFFQTGLSTNVSKEDVSFWEDLPQDALNQAQEAIVPLYTHSREVALLAWVDGKTNIRELIATFGHACIFENVQYSFIDWFRFPIADLLIAELVENDDDQTWLSSDQQQWFQREASSFVDLFPREAFPLKLPQQTSISSGIERLAGESGLTMPATAVMRETLLLCIAVWAEANATREESGNLEYKDVTYRDLLHFACSRLDASYRPHAMQMIEEHCEERGVRDMLKSWTQGLTDLIYVDTDVQEEETETV